MENNIVNMFTDKQKRTALRLGVRKFKHLGATLTKQYNSLCMSCKRIYINSKGQAKPEDFCKKCQPYAEKTREVVERLCK